MKFTDGAWLLQPGVQSYHPAEAYHVVEQDGALVVHAPTRAIRHRGDTLQGPLLTIRLSSPLPDVIKVRIEHHSGGADRLPKVPLAETAAQAKITLGADEAVLRSGAVEARVRRKDGWALSFVADGRVLTQSGFRGMGYIQWAGHGNHVHEQLSLGVGECVYGLGERFTSLVKNGQVVENWNRDGGTGSDQTYKSVPFYLTNRGYGVLVNESGPVSFEVASEKTFRVQFSHPGESLEYFVIHGPTPKGVLRKLTALTGRPALPPAWSFGLWLTTSFTTSYDEATVMSFIDGMKERDLPLHVFHFDCFWMREFEWCNFQWDARTFPDPAGLLQRLHERGLKISLWINPYIAQLSPLFEEGRRQGYLLKKANGEVWQGDLWQPGMGIVDFTNPDACAWYAGHLRRLLEMGVDCFKTDFGERIPTDVVYHDRSDPVGMHNLYPILYNETVFRVIEEVRGRGEAVVFARSSYTSGQRFPVHWGGDCSSTFESMAESLRGGLSLGLCGFGYWSHDIGGFEGLPPPAIYKRWVAFGLLSSHSRLHGSSSYRVPWHYNGEACDVLRFFTKLKCRLMPYLYAAAVEAHRDGTPVMRAMQLEFPSDPACDTLERQYLLGGSLLVAPVLSEDGSVDYYLPSGRWTHLLTGEVQAGGQWHRARHDFLSLPVFVRPGSIVPLGSVEDRPDYNYSDGVTYRVFEIGDGASLTCEIPALDGTVAVRVTVSRSQRRVSATVDGKADKPWRLQLAGVPSAAVRPGQNFTSDPLGVIFAAAQGSRRIECELN
ncbi:MAG TPA: alpha-xylosidase [Candidatus Didemnitutus sp.]|nr:alpha-xylosidase [Candidatus Didemnitutus sp.]